MTVPTIHLNGTSQRELSDGYEAAYRALTDAIAAVQAAAPNGRDYYVQGPTATSAAMTEHISRLERLASVQAEMRELYDAVNQ